MSIQQAFNATLASGTTALTALRFAYQHSSQYEAAVNEHKAKQLEKKANAAEKRAQGELKTLLAAESDKPLAERKFTTNEAQSELVHAQATIANDLRARAFELSPTDKRYEVVADQKRAEVHYAQRKKQQEMESLARMREAQEQQKAQKESLEIRKGILKGTSSEVREWRESFKKEGESK